MKIDEIAEMKKTIGLAQPALWEPYVPRLLFSGEINGRSAITSLRATLHRGNSHDFGG
jgi:hypothetical protein